MSEKRGHAPFFLRMRRQSDVDAAHFQITRRTAPAERVRFWRRCVKEPAGRNVEDFYPGAATVGHQHGHQPAIWRPFRARECTECELDWFAHRRLGFDAK